MVQNFDDYIKTITEVSEEKLSQRIGVMLTDFFQADSFKVMQKRKNIPMLFHLEIIKEKQLHLVIIESPAKIEEGETLELGDAQSLYAKVKFFISCSGNANSVDSPHNGELLRTETARTIWHLKRHQSYRGIEELFFHIFSFREVKNNLKNLSSVVFDGNFCHYNAISLGDLWEKGIEIPLAQPLAPPVTPPPGPKSPEGSGPSPANPGKGPTPGGPSPVSSINEFREGLLRLPFSERLEEIFQILKDAALFEEILQIEAGPDKFKNKHVGLSGYALDDLTNSLSLFILDNESEDDSNDSKILKKRQEFLLQCLKNIVYFCKNSDRRGENLVDFWDINTEAGGFAHWLTNKYKESKTPFSKITLFVLSLRVKATEKLIDPEADYQLKVYDLMELYGIASGAAKFVVDFTQQPKGSGSPLRALAAGVNPDSGYKAFVGAIPAEKLFSIYQDYGQKVLAANVRAFLQLRGKVNKGIVTTLKEEPHNFFAYNNGVSLISSDIEGELSEGVGLIKKATNLQIVNGGQTTAVLFEAKKSGIDLNNVYVLYKLTVIPETGDLPDEVFDKRDEFIHKISRYSNTQNKVTDTDLGTNTPFQVKFKKESERAIHRFDNKDGQELCWFYERSRGGYAAMVRFKNKQQKDRFEKSHPKNLKFDKSDLAKWLVSWEKRPYVASLGGEKCYNAFSLEITRLKEIDAEYNFVTSGFYQSVIAKGVLFRHLDCLIANAAWYRRARSYKVNTVEYTMALLHHLIDKEVPGYSMNWKKIWINQLAYISPTEKNKYLKVPVLDVVLNVLAQYVRSGFVSDENADKDVGEIVKKEETWKKMVKNPPRLSEISPTFIDEFCVPKIQLSEFPRSFFTVTKKEEQGYFA